MEFLNRANRVERIKNAKAKSFCPHSFKTKIKLVSDVPRVLISRLAYNKMWHYVDIADKEVGWLGTVIEDGNDFLIQDVFLLKQEVDHTETEITLDGLAEFGQEILSKPNGDEMYNNIRFWGHSHVNMGTSPSSQDEEQMEIFKESGHSFFIRGILNKSGRMEFTVFIYSAGIKIIDSEWAISEPVDESIRADIEAEFENKVTETVYAYPAQLGMHYGSHTFPNNLPVNVSNKIIRKKKQKKGGKK